VGESKDIEEIHTFFTPVRDWGKCLRENQITVVYYGIRRRRSSVFALNEVGLSQLRTNKRTERTWRT
jgi:hypothetical protein